MSITAVSLVSLLAVACGAPTDKPAPARPAGYTGLGAASVSPDVVARFAPPPVDAAVADRIGRVLDWSSSTSRPAARRPCSATTRPPTTTRRTPRRRVR